MLLLWSDMNLQDLLLAKPNNTSLALTNFVYNQQQALPFCPAMLHEELFIAKVINGQCTLFVDGVQFDLSTDCLIVLPPFTLYTIKNMQDVTLECALINLRALQDNKNILHYPQSADMDCVILPQNEIYPQIHQALVQLSKDKNLAHMCVIDIQNILHWLHHKTPSKNITADKQLFVIKNLLNVVHTQKEQLVVSNLAEQCGYSEFYLMKLFKKYLGTSCIDYAIGYKLTQLALELIATNKHFCDLAESVGFTNISYCNRQFKKMFATTPKEFRKQYQAE